MIKKFVALLRRSDTAADVENMRSVIEGPFKGDTPIDPDSKAPRADVCTFKLEASKECDTVGFYRTPGNNIRCRVGRVDSFESFRSRVAALMKPIDVDTLRIQCVEHREVSEESFLTWRDIYEGLSFTRKRPYQNRLETATPPNAAPEPEPKPKPVGLPTLRRPQATGQAAELAAAHLLATCMGPEPPVAEGLQAQVAALQTELRQQTKQTAPPTSPSVAESLQAQVAALQTELAESLQAQVAALQTELRQQTETAEQQLAGQTELRRQITELQVRLEGRFTELEARILALPQEERITALQQGSAHQSPRS